MPDLSAVKLFQGLPEKELKSLARLKEVTQPAGKEVITTGAHGVGFMVILEGEAEVELPRTGTRTLGPGDYFGEMALLDEHGRSATVISKTNLKLLTVPEWDFKGFLAAHPEVAFRLLKTLSERLREAEATG
jgi:CRP-like cAMP-binding protein